MKNMYTAVVFWLVVITCASSVLSVSLNNNDENQDIVMVVDDATSMHDAGKVQNGKFFLEDGKVLTLARKLTPVGECYSLGDTCGAAHWCCEGLSCRGWASLISGTCERNTNCYEKGHGCSPLNPLDPPCCYPNTCKTIYGETWGYCE